MIDTDKIKSYIQVEDYHSAYDEIYREYEKLTRDFLERHHVKLSEKGCLPDYCNLIIQYFPKHQKYAKKIKRFMFDEEQNTIEKIQNFIESYEDIYQVFHS